MTRIRAVALDVDGVLTDGTFWWGAEDQEYKRFSFRDIMGISRGKRAGLVFALISGEDSPLVDRFARKMGISDVFPGCKDKSTALRHFAEAHGLSLSEVCYMGDDINDLAAMEIAGLAASPSNAHPSALARSNLVVQHRSGDGAVRELIDILLSESTWNVA